MDQDKAFIIEHLDRKSNAILGFVVLQSIFLADKLSSEEFIQKIRGIDGLYQYLFIAHLFIVIFAVVFLFMIDMRITQRLDKENRRALQPHLTMAVKIVLVLLFGIIPVLVFMERLDH